ncbi:MAG TPA: glycosyltransferase [Solirubrobacteraceae bacterium]|nr:glycosyltransferase [Solirubrobacteraceae bacterium]
MRWGCVVLTQGGRPEVLDRAVRSLLRQRDVEVDVAVVGNGWRPQGLPDGVKGVHLERDAGIPAGRNAGVPAVEGDLLFFLDDDAELRDDDALARVERLLAGGDVGLVQLRVEPSDGGRRSRDWSPRVGAGGVGRSGEVTAVWEGAVALPRAVFDAVGGWPGDFRFVHEGVDLAWRVMDRGLRVHYAADVVALHPPPPANPTRHAYSTYYGARNRVWLARRHLPLPLGVVYAASFLLRALPRLRSPRERRALLRGYRDGLRGPAGPRRPLRARTLWRMTRAGRPPLL